MTEPRSGYRNVYSCRAGTTWLGPPWKSRTTAIDAARRMATLPTAGDRWEGTYHLHDVTRDHREPGNVIKLYGPPGAP
jgi:hypothetical protein